MNSYNAIGNLTSKPELFYTQANISYTRFSIAIDRYKMDCDKQVDFIPIQCWRTLAENVCQYLDKGSAIAVEGSLQSSNYTDKDGNKHYKLVVLASNIKFLNKPKSGQKNVDINSDTQSDTEDPFQDFGDNVVVDEQMDIDDNFLD